jgi:hypothetical protein
MTSVTIMRHVFSDNTIGCQTYVYMLSSNDHRDHRLVEVKVSLEPMAAACDIEGLNLNPFVDFIQ